MLELSSEWIFVIVFFFLKIKHLPAIEEKSTYMIVNVLVMIFCGAIKIRGNSKK